VTRCAALALIFAITGCAAPLASSSDPRIVVLPDAGIVVAQPPHVSVNGTGITHVSVGLANPTGHDVVIEATTDWFDNNQHAVGGLLSAPKRLTVPRFGTTSLESVSPSLSAVGFQIHIAPDS
jgi:hypothetical protein